MRHLLLLPCAAVVLLALSSRAADSRKAVVITAADLAPSSIRADEPPSGKWWLRRGIEGVPGGALLLTGKIDERPFPKDKLGEWKVIPSELYATPYRVPALEVDPKVKGWHRITVGLYNRPPAEERYLLPPRLWGRVSGEPYPEYLMVPEGSKGTVVETEWRLADLTGKTLCFEQLPATMSFPGHGWIGGISHVKLTPLTDAEVAAAKKQETLPPAKSRLFGLLDTPDEIYWWGNAHVDLRRRHSDRIPSRASRA